MGSLTPPAGGAVGVDAQILIYSIEGHDVYASLLLPLWLAAKTKQVEIVASELVRLEVTVRPRRQGNRVLLRMYDELLDGTRLRLLPVTRAVLEGAAQMRADVPSLRTPDAIHAATAALHQCAMFVTNDAGFRRVQVLPTVILDDLLAEP